MIAFGRHGRDVEQGAHCSLLTQAIAAERRLAYMSHSQMLGKFEYGGGPIFKVVLEC